MKYKGYDGVWNENFSRDYPIGTWCGRPGELVSPSDQPVRKRAFSNGDYAPL